MSEGCGSSGADGSGAATSGGSAGQAVATGGSGGTSTGTGGTSGSAGTPGMAGMPSSGGSGGTGSAGMPPALAGAGGSAGMPGGAGTPGGGAAAGSGAVAGSSGAPATGSCTFSVNSSISEKIGSVGIVEWSVDRATLDAATIEFGLDTNYGLTAPVDLAEPKYRTLLLGMKFGHTYHFKVKATAGGEHCESADFTLDTGPLPNGLPAPKVTTTAPDKLYSGFTISEKWGTNTKGPSFILDKDFDFVWVYPGEDDVIRTRMSFDGKAMWMRNTAQTDGSGVVRRVTLDGLKEDRWELPHTTHDLAVIPDGHLGLVGHASDGCDEILDFNPADGSLTSLFNAKQAHGQSMCHVNYLAYFGGDDSFVFSDWEASTLIKITRHGELVWVLNGTGSTISGTDWVHQHGVHVLAPDHLLVFSNGDSGQHSIVYELKLDLAGKSAMELWHYDASLSTGFGGDVQRLANGNTLITYSSSGVMQELDPMGNKIQEATWDIGNTLAYTERRPTLYGGPPPKIYE